MNIQTADLCDDNKEKEIQVLSAKFKNYGGLKKFSGQIITVKLDKSNWRLLEMLRDEDGEEKIVVVDNSQEFFGVVGDKLMAFAKKNNWKAIILNGYVRDIDETKNIDVGLLAIGLLIATSIGESMIYNKYEYHRGGSFSMFGSSSGLRTVN